MTSHDFAQLILYGEFNACTLYSNASLFFILLIELYSLFFFFELTYCNNKVRWHENQSSISKRCYRHQLSSFCTLYSLETYFCDSEVHTRIKEKCKDIVQKIPITWGNSKQNFRWSYFAHYCNNKMKCDEKKFTHKRTFTKKEVKAIYLASIQTYSRQILAWGWWQISTVYLYLSFVKKFNLWENFENASKKTLLCNKV